MFYIFGFYKFKRLTGLKKLKVLFQEKFIKNNIRGTIIFSKEGINGTISGKKTSIHLIKRNLMHIVKIKNFDSENFSECNFQPFHRGKIKIKKEVVPLGFQVLKSKATKNYIEPNKWNSLIEEPNVYLIDARKPFEYNVGTFKGSKNPNINNFRDFPRYLKKINKENKIAMFCTGGIRCEKATSLLKKKGYKNIFHLQGGILQYFNDMPKEKNLFEGECFVFDKRVALDQELEKGSYSICHACGMPVSIQDQERKEYRKGIQCHFCIDQFSDDDRKRFEERQKQIDRLKVENHKIYKD